MAGAFLGLLLSVIELVGVTGDTLRARAFLDANNVTEGDPLVLTVDFLGKADFASLHPPALAKAVNAKDWKVDDASAKTDTYLDARRLTYRVRPVHDGVLWFPALEFSYRGRDGTQRIVRANAIPVHARKGTQVVVAGMREDDDRMPEPPPLEADPGVALGEDELFAWRKALANPSADAFAAFDFPAAKMNEATEAIRAGNWSRARSIYRRLEWRVGQTPGIERGLVAALALRYRNPAAELPVWRAVFRPVLRYAWAGRLAIVAGALLAVALVLFLCGRLVRALASVVLVLAVLSPLPGRAGVFEEMERQMQAMRRQMNSMMGFPGAGFETVPQPRVAAGLSIDRKTLQVGDAFNFIVSLEVSRTVTLDNLSVQPVEDFGLTRCGAPHALPDGTSANPSNVVRRFAVPVRYDVPFNGRQRFRVGGMATRVVRQRFGSSRMSSSFSAETPELVLRVKPLPSAGQPKDYSGIVATHVTLVELPDLLKVETNDIVKIVYRLNYRGYLPAGFQPTEVAYEQGRAGGTVEWLRYLVADGVRKTPDFSISYYDPTRKQYRRASCGGTALVYR